MNRIPTLLIAAVMLLVTSGAAAGLDGVEKRVRHELVMLPFYSVFDNFEFKVEGTVVTLMGQVTRPTLRSDAERVVRRIEGISDVVNKIEVLPVSSNDDRIRRAVFRAIYYHPVLSRYGYQSVPPIHIVVKNGDVTLEGVVSNGGERSLAEVQANGVSGVFSVVNNLMVENRE
ncbi:MAG: BON domain-containing protein [Bryobacterales bacterium]|nr:BON domain-containing protein [Bryobacterales bacterium]